MVRADLQLLYNALCNFCAVLDARASPAWRFVSSYYGEEEDWESPECSSVAIVVVDAGTSAAEVDVFQQKLAARFPRAARNVCVLALSDEDAAVFSSSFPWMTSLYAGPQPVSWPSMIHQRVFLGCALHAESAAIVESMGVRMVVNCMSESGGLSEPDAKRLAIVHAKFPWLDDVEFDVLKALPRAVAAIDAGSRDGAVLVHCWRGASRSACAVAGWYIWQDCAATPLDVVMEHMKLARAAVSINPGFVAQLREWRKAVAGCCGGSSAVGRAGPPPLDDVVAALPSPLGRGRAGGAAAGTK